MTQQILPVNGGTQNIESTVLTAGIRQLSPQYIAANNLEPSPTQWIPGGRPIYRRLPAVSETYQIDFFNFVSPPNTAVAAELENIGYVYIAPGNQLANFTCEVTASDNKQSVIIQGGNIVWEYGKTRVQPALLDVAQLNLNSGRYVLTYQLEYDDDSRPLIYEVSEYSLTGQTLTLDSSTDSLYGWKYKTENAFLNSDAYWTNYDLSYTGGPQPTTAQLTWVSSLPSAYTKIVLRQPVNVSASLLTTAKLEILSEGVWGEAAIASLVQNEGRFSYEFDLVNPVFTRGWRVSWTNPQNVPRVYVQDISVTGQTSILRKPSGPSPLASLAIYEENLLPPEVTYCNLAILDITADQKIEKVEDRRSLIFRDYQPVANWLTDYWDGNLVNLYTQVENYQETWMSPEFCLFGEYEKLIEYGIYLPGEIPSANIIPN